MNLQRQLQTHANETAKAHELAAEHPFFMSSDISPEALERLSELMFVRDLHVGEYLLSANNVTNSVFFIVSGSVSVVSERMKIAVIDERETAGAVHLIQPQAFAHDLIASTATTALELDGAGFDQFAREYPESAFKIQGALSRHVALELNKAQDHLRLIYAAYAASN